MTQTTQPGIVIIGRNEGARLVACLDSLATLTAQVVYVDSGSTDRSVEMARARGIDVLELPMDRPFTAARARNAGFNRLSELHPGTEFVQFMDGDCKMAPGWLDHAVAFLAEHSAVAIVCGRRKELYPEVSVYNRLCDADWNSPTGEVQACGGDFLIRAEAFHAVGGFNPGMIAGEEPELCYRLRRSGWKIYRADKLMTLHDAAMTRFSQWLRRSARSGYAFALGAALHWNDPGAYNRRENLRILFWAACLPLLSIAGALLFSPWLLLLLLAYPIQYIRLVRWVQRTYPDTPALSYALFLVLGNWPEFYGQMLFLVRHLRGDAQTLIEYK